MKDVKFEAKKYYFRNLGVALRDLHTERGQISPGVNPTLHRRTCLFIHKDASVTFNYLRYKLNTALIDGPCCRNRLRQDIHTPSESRVCEREKEEGREKVGY